MQTFRKELTVRFGCNVSEPVTQKLLSGVSFVADVAVASAWLVGGQSSAVLQTAKGLA